MERNLICGIGTPSGYPQINYLVSNQKKLRLMEGDADTFKDVLTMIDDYEGMYL